MELMRKKVGGKIGRWGKRWFEKVSECHQVQIILLLASVHFTFLQVKIRQSSLHRYGLLLTHLIWFNDRNYLNQGTKRRRKQDDKTRCRKTKMRQKGGPCAFTEFFFYIPLEHILNSKDSLTFLLKHWTFISQPFSLMSGLAFYLYLYLLRWCE